MLLNFRSKCVVWCSSECLEGAFMNKMGVLRFFKFWLDLNVEYCMQQNQSTC